MISKKLFDFISDFSEKQHVFALLDAFIDKKKLKDALSGVLHDVK